MAEWLVPVALFGFLVLIMGQLTRLLSDISINRTMREALRSDPASVPILAERLGGRTPQADSLLAWIFLATAGGIVLMALFEPVGDRRDMFQAAIVPLVIGLVVLVHARRARSQSGPGDNGAAPVAPAAPLAPPPPVPPTPRGRRSVRRPA